MSVAGGGSPAGHAGRPGRSAGGERGFDRGAAAVEAAFVFPILLLIVFGIIDFGRMLNAQMSVTEAAQQGVRVASFGDEPTARVQEIAGSEAVATTVACPAADALGADTYVTVTYPFEFITPVGALAGLVGGAGFGGTVELTGRGVMPCQ